MISKDGWMIRVPASSANLGPGFDSIGLAVNLYLTLELEFSEKWEFIAVTPDLNQFPKDTNHFIYKVAEQVALKNHTHLPPCRVMVSSEIPLARGLGSSAAAIVAGIELADVVGGLGLSKQDKLLIATELEGHPDNVGASIFGGLVIGSYHQKHVDMISYSNLAFDLVAVIPQEELLTKVAREALPVSMPYCEAIQASSKANVLIAALLTENWKIAGKMMEQDLFHQPYRRPLVPFYSEVEKGAKWNGAIGVALSGAGPTLLCFIEKGKGIELSNALQKEFPMMDVKPLSIENKGSFVCKKQFVN